MKISSSWFFCTFWFPRYSDLSQLYLQCKGYEPYFPLVSLSSAVFLTPKWRGGIKESVSRGVCLFDSSLPLTTVWILIELCNPVHDSFSSLVSYRSVYKHEDKRSLNSLPHLAYQLFLVAETFLCFFIIVLEKQSETIDNLIMTKSSLFYFPVLLWMGTSAVSPSPLLSIYFLPLILQIPNFPPDSSPWIFYCLRNNSWNSMEPYLFLEA